MSIVVDTSVLVDHLRGDPRARNAISEAVEAGAALLVSVMTRVELLAGMRPVEEADTRALLEALDEIVVDRAIAERAGSLASRYLRSHPGIDTVDYLIAATAEQRNAELWTRNVKHFPMLPGLVPPY